MNNKDLFNKFLSHSPDFYRDLELQEIDNKHSKIIKEAYQQFKDKKQNKNLVFRYWKEQSDYPVPSQFSLLFSPVLPNLELKLRLKKP